MAMDRLSDFKLGMASYLNREGLGRPQIALHSQLLRVLVVKSTSEIHLPISLFIQL